MTKKFKASGILEGQSDGGILFKVQDSEGHLWENEWFGITGSINRGFIGHVKEHFGDDLTGLKIKIVLSR